MKRVLFLTNYPSPYRVHFFDELGKYVDVTVLESKVLISLKNISKEPLNMTEEELTELFVRGDASRNREGSGLGLNIAKSLMEVQNGSLHLTLDGDLFKVTLTFPKAE